MHIEGQEIAELAAAVALIVTALGKAVARIIRACRLERTRICVLSGQARPSRGRVLGS